MAVKTCAPQGYALCSHSSNVMEHHRTLVQKALDLTICKMLSTLAYTVDVQIFNARGKDMQAHVHLQMILSLKPMYCL